MGGVRCYNGWTGRDLWVDNSLIGGAWALALTMFVCALMTVMGGVTMLGIYEISDLKRTWMVSGAFLVAAVVFLIFALVFRISTSEWTMKKDWKGNYVAYTIGQMERAKLTAFLEPSTVCGRWMVAVGSPVLIVRAATFPFTGFGQRHAFMIAMWMLVSIILMASGSTLRRSRKARWGIGLVGIGGIFLGLVWGYLRLIPLVLLIVGICLRKKGREEVKSSHPVSSSDRNVLEGALADLNSDGVPYWLVRTGDGRLVLRMRWAKSRRTVIAADSAGDVPVRGPLCVREASMFYEHVVVIRKRQKCYYSMDIKVDGPVKANAANNRTSRGYCDKGIFHKTFTVSTEQYDSSGAKFTDELLLDTDTLRDLLDGYLEQHGYRLQA